MTPTPQESIPALGENPSFWHKVQHKALQKSLYRAIHLARCNPDYRLKYPNEARDNPKNEVKKECHKEAQIRILKDHEMKCRRAHVPPVQRPKRMNRVG